VSIPGAGPHPLPTPQTLAAVAAMRGSPHRGSRWRTAAFFCDVAAVLFLVAAWSTDRAAVAPTALVVGGVAIVVATIALVRSWRSAQRAPAVVWLVLALAALGVAALA